MILIIIIITMNIVELCVCLTHLFINCESNYRFVIAY